MSENFLELAAETIIRIRGKAELPEVDYIKGFDPAAVEPRKDRAYTQGLNPAMAISETTTAEGLLWCMCNALIENQPLQAVYSYHHYCLATEVEEADRISTEFLNALLLPRSVEWDPSSLW